MAIAQSSTDKIVNAHFMAAWKEDRVYLRNIDGEAFISDGFCLRRLDGPLPLLFDKNICPRIPQKGEGFRASQGQGFSETGCPDFGHIVPDRKLKGLVELAVTAWRFESSKGDLCAVLAFPDARAILISAKMMALFGPGSADWLTYKFFGSAPDRVVRVEDSAGRLAGALMPMVGGQAQRNLNLPPYTLPVVKQPKVTLPKPAKEPKVKEVPAATAHAA